MFFRYTIQAGEGSSLVQIATRSIARQLVEFYARYERCCALWRKSTRRAWRTARKGPEVEDFAFVKVPERLVRRDESRQRKAMQACDRWLTLCAKHGVESMIRTGPEPGDMEIFDQHLVNQIRAALKL